MNNALVVTSFVITWSGMAFFGYVYVINKPQYAVPTYPTSAQHDGDTDGDTDDDVPPQRVKLKPRLQKFTEDGGDHLVMRNQVKFPKDATVKKKDSVLRLKLKENSVKSSQIGTMQRTDEIMKKKLTISPSKSKSKLPKSRLSSAKETEKQKKESRKTTGKFKVAEPHTHEIITTKKGTEGLSKNTSKIKKPLPGEKVPSQNINPHSPSTTKGEIASALEKCKIEKLSILQTRLTVHNKAEVEEYITSQCTNGKTFGRCEHRALVGPLLVRLEQIDMKTLASSELNFVKKGGWWVPHDCLETQSVAIVIPFRNRYQHLPVLLRQLVPILYRQRLHHRIFVVEQDDNNDFNRGKLMNVGYAEALKQFPYTCFVFHDVDLIPENDKINYGCKHSPMHLSVAIDKFHYRLPYTSIFGGIEMFSTEDYKTVNGFSNIFYSWGGEDDVLSSRLTLHGMKIHRQSVQTARYTMLKHTAKDKQRTPDLIAQTDLLMRTARNHPQDDGLTSLQYKVNQIVDHQLYTLIKVDLQKEKEETFGINIR